MQGYIKLSKWAKLHDYTYHGAFLRFQSGKIKNTVQLENGTILVKDIDDQLKPKTEHNVIYSRVSSSENKNNLDTQATRVAQFCNAKGWIVNEIVKECASGLNDNRPKLLKLLSERKATRIIVEHKDRLTRFGFNYIKALYPECEMIIINEVDDDKEDLVQDFISIVTSYCARIYGNRRSKRKTEQLIKELQND
jgi:predicted site-specific integrase-resolvase